MKIKDRLEPNIRHIAIVLLTAIFLYLANREFYEIAWGTGTWMGGFSVKWGLMYFIYTIFVLMLLVVEWNAFQYPDAYISVVEFLLTVRTRLGPWRWALAGIFLIAPIWLFQYTYWGIVLSGPFTRILIWLVATMLQVYFLTQDNTLMDWRGFLTGFVLSTSAITMAVSLRDVTAYPFSLGWSEGNRLWDYSVLFGRSLYDYPMDKPIPVLLDFGRQFVGGIPFLLPGIAIWQARLWVGLTYIVPSLLCGLFAYRFSSKKVVPWIIASLWAYTYLGQGSIHPPLILSAILVALAWGQSLWVAVPLIMIGSYFAEVSRWTWMFAPGMWAAMLEFSSAKVENGRIALRDWARTITVGLAGLFAGYILPFLIERTKSQLTGGVGGITVTDVVGEVSSQPLLWYRLLPNATYETGIFVGLLLATGPLLIVLIYLGLRQWRLSILQKLSIILPLLAFLVVGLIVSVKIGGGGDLHNMDMFLIGLLFAGAVAWRNIDHQWVLNGREIQWGIRLALVLLIVIPGYGPLLSLKPLRYENLERIAILTDTANINQLNSLPPDDVTQAALDLIRSEVNLTRAKGEILFMDQRQLLTFGYIIDVPLVPEYDKKVLINNAMSGDALYFKQFYKDLAAHRFSLIITSPLRKPLQDSSHQFGEENNAWVKWVSIPTRCYYESKVSLKEVGIQLLVPKADTSDCSSSLPEGTRP